MRPQPNLLLLALGLLLALVVVPWKRAVRVHQAVEIVLTQLDQLTIIGLFHPVVGFVHVAGVADLVLVDGHAVHLAIVQVADQGALEVVPPFADDLGVVAQDVDRGPGREVFVVRCHAKAQRTTVMCKVTVAVVEDARVVGCVAQRVEELLALLAIPRHHRGAHEADVARIV